MVRGEYVDRPNHFYVKEINLLSCVVEFVTFYLKKKFAASDFLIVSDKFNKEFLSKQKGYVSRQLLVDGEMWADMVVWKTMDDAKTAISVSYSDAIAREYVSMLNFNKKGCTLRHLSVEKNYDVGK